MQKITTCLWFDNNIEEAVSFYTSVFKNSKITGKTHYGENMPLPKGTVLTMSFEIEGREFLGLNGGPVFKFSEAISLVVNCENQEEVDTIWNQLLEGGQPQQCGWLKDKFGLSWQVIPTDLLKLQTSNEPEKINRMMGAMMQMVKLDMNILKKAYHGEL